MRIRLRGAATAELACRTRLPFRFGAVTVTAAPLLHLRVEVEAPDGRVGIGLAGDLLVPRWFRKDVDRPAAADQAALRASVAAAVAAYAAHAALPCFAHWQHAHARVEGADPATPELLELGFGIALVERALLDATCRLAGVPFAAALRTDLLGRAFPNLPAPRHRIAVRHTVGRLDPLRAAAIPAGERCADDLPQALDEVLRAHGVRWLKIKIGGGVAADAERLAAIGALLGELDRGDVQITLDGNEQFASYDELRELWHRTAATPAGRALLARVRWVEQPLARARTGRPDWHACPLLLDEGDCQLRSWPDSGYDGVSVKNCKGVFRALLAGERCAAAPRLFQSSEDLTNLPPLPLQQDLCTAQVLGCTHSERNGHHYFPGLDHLPGPVVAAALAAHGDLYAATPRGARLRLRGGELSTASLHHPGYGVAPPVVDALDRALDWQAVG
jgi:hypothetical protein